MKWFLRFIGFGLIAVLFSGNVCHAQERSKITGRILDEITRKPIANVNLFFEHSQKGAITDSLGRFVLENVPQGNHVLVVEHIAYGKKRVRVSVAEGQTRRLDIFLSPRVLSFDQVVFTASRHAETIFSSTRSVAMTSESEIAARTSPNTADAIREMPGILVQKTTAGHGAPIVRGLIGKDVLLLYNGIRLNKPTFRFGANQYMNTIDVESLDRIEVIKGPGSVMYGSDAIGGVVNMISELPLSFEMERRWNTTFTTRYGSADQSRIVHSGLTSHFGPLVLSSAVTWKKIGDLRAGRKVGAQKPTGYREWNGNLRLGVRLNQQTSLDFDVLTVQQSKVPRYDKYVTGQYETYLYDPQNRFLSSFTLFSRPEPIPWISSLQWNFSYQLEEEGTIQRKTGKEYLIKNRNNLRTLGSFLQLNSILFERHVLTYGYEIYLDRVASTQKRVYWDRVALGRSNFPDGSRYRSFGLFVNDNILFRSDFDVTIGFRWSRMKLSSRLKAPFGVFEDEYADLTGTVGLSYKWKSWFNFIANYARGFRAPNFNDTVVLKVSNAGVDAPSPGLAPEKSHNMEVGIKVSRPSMKGSLFLFYNRLIDLIDRYRGTYKGLEFFDENHNGVRDPDEVDIYQKRNVARAYIAGWELSLDCDFHPGWEVKGNAFWTYGENITFAEPMSRIPPLMGLISLRYYPHPKWSVESFIRAASSQKRLSTRDKADSRIDPGGTPGWWTLNFRGKFKLATGVQFNIIVGNVFDTTYKEHGSGVYSPGRNLVFGFQYQGS